MYNLLNLLCYRVKLVMMVHEDYQVDPDLPAQAETEGTPDQKDQMEIRVLLETEAHLVLTERWEIREMLVQLVCSERMGVLVLRYNNNNIPETLIMGSSYLQHSGELDEDFF